MELLITVSVLWRTTIGYNIFLGRIFLTHLAVSHTIPYRLFGSSLNWCFRNSCLRPLGTSVERGTKSNSSRNRAGHLTNSTNRDDFYLIISTQKKPLFVVSLAPLWMFPLLITGWVFLQGLQSGHIHGSNWNCAPRTSSCHEFETCEECNGTHASCDTSSGLEIGVIRVYIYPDCPVVSVKLICLCFNTVVVSEMPT